EYGNTLYNLSLNDIANLTLLETLGLESVLWSMILQRQEEVDIFLTNATKKIVNFDINVYDLAAFDIIRSRDRAQSFANISNNSIIQENLAKIYPNGDHNETVEAWVGEDHLDGSNFGMVMNASMLTQYTYLRDSDNFWYEKPEMFTYDERLIIRNTTLRDIIIRNINNSIGSWSQYIMRYRIDLKYVYFKIQLHTSDANSWFEMGFGPDDDGMKRANLSLALWLSSPLCDDLQDPTLVPKFSMSDTKAVTVEFKRLLRLPGKKPITNAYSPTSNVFTYHQNNRRVNFYSSKIGSATSTDLQRFVRLIHGCG
ncbi:46364_t:CDS:2, partial [Gigaspora margarita]